jgi:hypothetical protein
MEKALHIWIPIIQGIVTILTLLIGAAVAVIGLSSWKRQFRWKLEYDLAERVLRSVYKIRDAIAVVRYPWIGPAEYNSAIAELKRGAIPEMSGRAPKGSEFENQEAIYDVRWREVASAMSALHPDILEVEAIWRSDKRNPKQLLLALQASAHELAQMVDEYVSPSSTVQQRRDARARLLKSELGASDDDFSATLNGRINAIEEFFETKLRL